MSKYLACGNIMSDRIKCLDGAVGPWNMGGPAFYALAGMRLWTTDCKLVCRTGEDYASSYGKWMQDNGVSCESVKVCAEEHTRFTLCYDRADGGFHAQGEFSFEHLGYLKTKPEDIGEACAPETKGIYIAQNADHVFWDQMAQLREETGLRIMWEMEYSSRIYAQTDFLQKILNTGPIADMWSINHNEASHLFSIPREKDEDILNELMKLPFEFVFYRVGSRGSFAVHNNNAYFCPSVDIFEPKDPTGCGNCSTGAAMYAFVSGKRGKMVAAMANVSAAYNIAQYGPYLRFTTEDTENAAKLAQKCAQQLD